MLSKYMIIMRNQLLISQKKLSTLTGVPLSTIKTWETDKALPSYENFKILIDFFKAYEVCEDTLEDMVEYYNRNKNKK